MSRGHGKGRGSALFATALALIGHEYRAPTASERLRLLGATVGAAVASWSRSSAVSSPTAWAALLCHILPVGCSLSRLPSLDLGVSRDEGARHTDVSGLVTFSAAPSSSCSHPVRQRQRLDEPPDPPVADRRGSRAVRRRRTAPSAAMFDMTLFRQRAFVGSPLRPFECRGRACSRCFRTCRSTCKTSCTACRRAYASCRSPDSYSSYRSRRDVWPRACPSG